MKSSASSLSAFALAAAALALAATAEPFAAATLALSAAAEPLAATRAHKRHTRRADTRARARALWSLHAEVAGAPHLHHS